MASFLTLAVVLLLFSASADYVATNQLEAFKCENTKDTCCTSPVPGLAQMAQGFDITEFDLVPASTKLLSPNGFKHVLFKFTCNEGKNWTHPDSNVTYDLPDQVDSIVPKPGGTLDANVEIVNSLSDIKKNLAVDIGLSVDFRLGSFSASAAYRETTRDIIQKKKTVAKTSAYISSHIITFAYDKLLEKGFRIAINQELPARYEDDPEAYDNFIKKYGTHYFDSARFGGHLYMKSAIDSQFFQSKSEHQIETNLKAQYKIVAFHASGHHSNETVSEEFRQNSKFHFFYLGGQPTLISSMDYQTGPTLQEWASSVPKNPWLFSGQSYSIVNLISNSTIKAQVKKAITLHQVRALLNEVEFTQSLGTVSLSKESAKKLADIKSALEKPNFHQLHQLAKDLNELLIELRDKLQLPEFRHSIVPFLEQTFLCFKWYCYGDYNPRLDCAEWHAKLEKAYKKLHYDYAILFMIERYTHTLNHEEKERIFSEAYRLLDQFRQPGLDKRICGDSSVCKETWEGIFWCAPKTTFQNPCNSPPLWRAFNANLHYVDRVARIIYSCA